MTKAMVTNRNIENNLPIFFYPINILSFILSNKFDKCMRILSNESTMNYQPELLAPAGSLEKLKVAVLYGANAVYCGGQKFA